jgi:hypothetical protein
MSFLRNIPSESLQVLVFICLPLTLLLIAFIFWSVRNSKRIARFPTFTVTVEKLGHEGYGFVAYREGERNLQFDSMIVAGSRLFSSLIKVRIPKDLSEKDVVAIVPKLAQGLEELPYEFSIYRPDGSEIPKGEYASKA